MPWFLLHRQDPNYPDRVLWGSPAEIEISGIGAPRQRIGRMAGHHTIIVGSRASMPAEMAALPGVQKDIISRKHVEFWQDENSVWMKDLGSLNGTYINDVRVAPNVDMQVKRGDTVSLGGHKKNKVGQKRMKSADAFRYELIYRDAKKSMLKRPAAEHPNADTPGGKRLRLADVPSEKVVKTGAKNLPHSTDVPSMRPASSGLPSKESATASESTTILELCTKKECMFCLELLAFPVTIIDCHCDGGPSLCFSCWDEWAKKESGKCPVCEKANAKCTRNRQVEETVELVLRVLNDSSATKEWIERRKRGEELWKMRGLQTSHKVTIPVSGSLKNVVREGSAPSSGHLSASGVENKNRSVSMKVDAGTSANGLSGKSSAAAVNAEVGAATPVGGSSGDNRHSSHGTKTACFPAGSGNFGLNLQLDIVSKHNYRIPQHVIVSESTGMAKQLGIHTGDRLISFWGTTESEHTLFHTLLPRWRISNSMRAESTSERVKIQNILLRIAESLKSVVARRDCCIEFMTPTKNPRTGNADGKVADGKVAYVDLSEQRDEDQAFLIDLSNSQNLISLESQ